MKPKHLCIILITILCSCQNNKHSADFILEQMCQRLFPQHANSFVFELLTDSLDMDRFILESVGEKIHIKGNNNNSLAVGLNHYLKYYCHTHVSWYVSDKIEMPESLPALPEQVCISSKCNNRFFLNYCTFGYTMPYWKWTDWERLIDWMALNGVTMPLAITGQESIWQKVWSKLGLQDLQIRSYFTGPAHLPWHRMANVDYWQSPLPQSWLDNQEELQKKILKREREFNMTPVLPAFAGHVPSELSEIYPNAKISQISRWGGFEDKYRSHFLDPSDSLYNVIQRMYLEEQTKVFGTDHIYGIDPFNEIDSPDWDESFLSDVSAKIYKSIYEVDPIAQWLQMTWMFYYDKEKWTQPRIRSFLNAVPDNKLILLDYYCDKTELWRETDKYYSKPYIWCYLGNFGGNTMLVGNIDDIESKINKLFIEGGDNIYGLGVTLEGFDSNPFMYEYVFDKAWDYDISASKWIANWAQCRGGNKDTHILNAWEALHKKIYSNDFSKGGQAVLMNARPQLRGWNSWTTCPDISYNNGELWKIWVELLKAKDVDNGGYRFDVVNIGRQTLGNLFSMFRDEFTTSYTKKDIAGMKLWSDRIDTLFIDVDRLLSCETNFSIGKWIRDAKEFGVTDEEKDYYEENARCLLTVWGQKATQLNDYANRGWGGLTGTYYRQRWKKFTDAVLASAIAGEIFDEKEFAKNITDFEYEWTLQKESFPLVSEEDPVTVAKELICKYGNYFINI